MGITNEHIVIFSANPWDGMMFQRQLFAIEFAKNKNTVSYIENIPQQKMTTKRIIRFLRGQKTYLDCSLKIEKPDCIEVFSPICLPESILGANYFNREAMRRLADKILSKGHPSFFISYIAGKPVIDLYNFLQPVNFIYASIHNYKGLGLPDCVVNAEVEIVRLADRVLADSSYVASYLSDIRGTTVERCLPGVDFEKFHSAFRGDEVMKKKTIGYFGFVGEYCDIGYFNRAMDEGYNVILIGEVAPSIKSRLNKNITLLPTVLNENLPKLIEEIDIILLPYFDNARTKGVIPAKLFECLATGKPVFWPNINETFYYKEVVYTVESYDDFIIKLDDLNEDSFFLKRDLQIEIAKAADWPSRFRQFEMNCEEVLTVKKSEGRSY